jgi:hypothetical protein
VKIVANEARQNVGFTKLLLQGLPRWSFFGEVGVARGGVMTMMLVGKLNDVSMVCVISHGGCMCRWKDWLHK